MTMHDFETLAQEMYDTDFVEQIDNMSIEEVTEKIKAFQKEKEKQATRPNIYEYFENQYEEASDDWDKINKISDLEDKMRKLDDSEKFEKWIKKIKINKYATIEIYGQKINAIQAWIMGY